VAPEAFFGYFHGLGFSGKVNQLAVVRDIFEVALDAAHRSFVPFLVACHALAMMGALKTNTRE